MIKMKKLFTFTCFIALLVACKTTTDENENNQPNIIVIMVDDMGFSDPGCFGGEVQTPNIDKLAESGLRLTNFYNSSRCSPTRASLLTGKYPHEVGLHRNGRNLKRTTPTLAEILKENGYSTGMIGKWHLSKSMKYNKNDKDHQDWLDHQIDPDIPFTPDINTYPVNRGFEKHYGIIWGVVDFFDPFSLVNGTEAVKKVPKDYYITNALNDSAVAYVKEFSKKEKPFFLYLAHTAPHWPLHALDEDIAKYEGVYDKGWDTLRVNRYKKQLDLGLFKEGDLTLPKVMGDNWSKLSDDEKKFQVGKMKAHAAMIDRVDQGIGNLISALKETGEYENTFIIFLSDNGASPETPTKPGYDRSSRTRDGRKIYYEIEGFEYAGPQTTYSGIGRAWANAANTPFRYWKKESFEGGNHTACVVHWPAGITKNIGGFVPELTHVMDILPTALDMADVEYPETFKDSLVSPPSGKSLLPVLKGNEREGHKTMCFEHVNGRAIIEGEWKLVAPGGAHNKFNDFKSWQLYHIASDPTETNNVITDHPEISENLSKKWDEWWAGFKDLR